MAGIAKDCSANMGGIVAVYIANFDDVASIAEASGEITTITMEASKTFKTYEFARNTGAMTSTYTIDEASGVKYVTTEVALQFNRMETAKRVEMAALVAADARVMVKDANGKYWFLGHDEPVTATASDGATGTARGDANKYGITLTDISKEYPMEVPTATAEAVIS